MLFFSWLVLEEFKPVQTLSQFSMRSGNVALAKIWPDLRLAS